MLSHILQSVMPASDVACVCFLPTEGAIKKKGVLGGGGGGQNGRQLINKKYPDLFVHPENETIRDVTHMLWTGSPIDPSSSGRNAVFYGDKAIDRSPCGTGTSARLAQLYTKGKLKKGEEYIHESFIGSKFIGCVEEETTLCGKLAIIPSIKGWAKIYGYNTITIDEDDDPYALGFQVI